MPSPLCELCAGFDWREALWSAAVLLPLLRCNDRRPLDRIAGVPRLAPQKRERAPALQVARRQNRQEYRACRKESYVQS
jgi:hypothetical protein